MGLVFIAAILLAMIQHDLLLVIVAMLLSVLIVSPYIYVLAIRHYMSSFSTDNETESQTTNLILGVGLIITSVISFAAIVAFVAALFIMVTRDGRWYV